MKRSIAVTTLALALTIGSTAHAWKPVMHVTLADAVLDELRNSPSGLDLDAVANFQNQTSGGTLGTFELDALVRQAVLTHPDQFRAGVLGPDAFPDLITGQSIIHPHDETGPGPGADDWLRRLWQAAYSEAQTTGHDEPLAFVTGFLVHAAGDMFAHTFVNHYADGPFDITTDNAQRHIIVEGYVAKHIPDPASSSISITGVERFIFENMIDARRGGDLYAMYRRKSKPYFSFPYLFSQLWSEIEDDNKAYRAKSFKDPIARTVHAYRRAWQQDIIRGLRRLPDVSAQLASAVMLNPARSLDRSAAESVLETYRNDYLLSMLGAPDFVGDLVGVIDGVVNNLKVALAISFDPFEAFKKKITNYFVEKATGLTVSDWQDMTNNPACWMVMEPTLSGVQGNLCSGAQPVRTTHPTCPVVRGESCRNEVDAKMGLSDTRTQIQWQDFPPAYNTVTMSKLIFLSAAGRRALMSSLGFPASEPMQYDPGISSTAVENAMVGFIQSLDDSREWGAHAEQALPHFDCYLYQRLFLRQLNDSTRGQSYAYGDSYSGLPEMVCPDLVSIAPDSGSGSGPLCTRRARFEIALDRPADVHGAVVDLQTTGPGHATSGFVHRGSVISYVDVDLEPVRTPQTLEVRANRMSEARATVDVRPASAGMWAQRRAVGGQVTIQDGDSILGGQTISVEAIMDCPLVVQGEPILIELVDVQGVIRDRVITSGRTNDTHYPAALYVPHLSADEDFEIRVTYLNEVSTMRLNVLATQVGALYFDRETVITSVNPTSVTGTVELSFTPSQSTDVHLGFSPGLSGPSSVTFQPGETRIDFPIQVGATGYAQSCHASVGWMEAVGDEDAPQTGQFSGRERYAEIIMQSSNFSAECLDAEIPDARIEALEYLSAPYVATFPPTLFEPEGGAIDPRDGPHPGPEFD